MEKVYSREHGGQNHYNKGQAFIELVVILFIAFTLSTIFRECSEEGVQGVPQYNFIKIFTSKVGKLHDKRNKSIRAIRESEPGGGDSGSSGELPDSPDSYPDI